ncbi:MAG: DNA polymerase III subunit gamma/tau [Thermoflexales bacterium]|nr:DNA polymerase III subunit gamma/tau [Thermoflexales bacterium]
MSAQAFYRRWRPQTFDEVVGQEHVTQTLRNAVAAGRTGHAYLFAGPRGTGKTTMARLLAKAVNCTHPDPSARPCNACAICTAVAEGRLLDLIEIDAASNRGIEDIRELRDKIHFAPAEARYKVYVVDESHMLTNEAFNALLKTLEEPPPHALFVLATTDPQKMPATVLSRCQRFDFRRLTLREISGRLAKLAEAEGLEVENGVLELVARQATGSMRDALSLLDQLAAFSTIITLEQARLALGVGDLAHVSTIVDGLARSEPASGLDAINRAVEEGADVRQLARQIVDHLRTLLLLQVRAPGSQGLVDLPDEQVAAMEARGRQLAPPAVIRAIKLFNQAAGELRSSWQPQLQLELAYLEALLPAPTAESAPPPAAPSQPAPGPRKTVAQAKQAVYTTASAPPPPSQAAPSRALPAGPPAPPVADAAGEENAASPPSDPTPPASRPPGGAASFTLEQVTAHWGAVLARLRERSLPAQALLNSSRLAGVEGNTLVLSWPSSLLKERYENVRTQRLVEDVIAEILGQHLSTRAVLSAKGAERSDRVVEEAVKSLGAVVNQ